MQIIKKGPNIIIAETFDIIEWAHPEDSGWARYIL
jgi:hypothetical protein